MDVIYGLLPLMTGLGLVAVLVLFWAIRGGQYDDMDGNASRILMDEDITPADKPKQEKKEDDADA
jgi:cbb3-type cytochrome oxidase maturation protein